MASSIMLLFVSSYKAKFDPKFGHVFTKRKGYFASAIYFY